MTAARARRRNVVDERLPSDAVPLAPCGLWLVASSRMNRPVRTDTRYPCRCRPPRDGDSQSGCNPIWCPCAGRADPEAMPRFCCGRRYRPAEPGRPANWLYDDYRSRTTQSPGPFQLAG
jgi:hypothetical protein